ncbi:ABC transporter substrate-binding protein [Agrobacterium vitis]|nr:ABC transporter substrate-binding protein [Allorhizobium ampelinum]MVA49298.1 ABC transporter substrate-binding protein [Agrobacterium vitis]MVA69454.1 ABC transporter substrate-binding protein [Agrobacterium vitis]NSZ54720.1 ABC transporter substrate-binding protein [Agrobacterium vitis]NTA33712.1 ABC transporter substrate-binding protein [Agrobacterium vitis]
MMTELKFTRRGALGLLAAAPLAGWAGQGRAASQPIKIGLVLTMSGPFASSGQIMANAAKLYLETEGKAVLGDIPVELVIRDDGGANPDVAKRLVQELVTRDKVQYLGGFQWTPNANAVAPLLMKAKMPCVLFNAAGANTTQLAPWYVRTAFTHWQVNQPLGEWAAAKRGFKRAYLLTTDFAPGHDAEEAFTKGFTSKGGSIVASVKMPIQSTNFVPFLLAAKQEKPDVIFAFHPGGVQASAFMRAYQEADLRGAGIQLIGPGDLTSDEELPNIGAAALGVLTAGQYSMAGDRPANVAFVEAWKKAYTFMPVRPNYMAVGAYDGMHLICSAIAATKGAVDAAGAMAAMKTFKAEQSPRGPISIDPETRDIVQNIYIREVREKNGELANVELETIPAVKDPWKVEHPL